MSLRKLDVRLCKGMEQASFLFGPTDQPGIWGFVICDVGGSFGYVAEEDVPDRLDELAERIATLQREGWELLPSRLM